jgi:hypothetical protein
MKKTLSFLPENPFIETFSVPDVLYTDRRNRYYPVDIKLVNDKTKEIFDSIDLKIGGIIIFKKHTNGMSPVHSDLLLVDNVWVRWNAAVNYNLTGSESKMMWFKTDLEEICIDKIKVDQPIEYNLSGIHYGKIGNSNTTCADFTLIEEDNIRFPTLVRTDVPHTAINLDSKDRICASIRFNYNYTFQELSEKFDRIDI